MRWVLLAEGDTSVDCISATTSCAEDRFCYALEYTPGYSGTVTSVTTGFRASCTGSGPQVSQSSCFPTDNSNVIYACGAPNFLMLIQASSNTTNFEVTDGVPLIIHQICITVEAGEFFTFTEDQGTDLTVSINRPGQPGVTDFPSFTPVIVDRASCGSLPVTWLSFDALVAGKTAALNWNTADEVEHDRFVVERSVNGADFTAIGEVGQADRREGSGNSYSFIDGQPRAGVNYYRLRQVDLDGTISYSPIRELSFAGIEQSVRAYPNPTNDLVYLSGGTTEWVSIYDRAGRLVKEQAYSSAGISLEAFPAGLYLLRLSDATSTRAVRVFKR